MITFKDYMAEGFFQNFLGGLRRLFTKAFSGMKFGRSNSTKINIPNLVNEDGSERALMGFLSEYATAYYLAKEIEKDNKGQLSGDSGSAKLEQLYNNKKRIIEQAGGQRSELQRMDDSGKKLASQMWKDMISTLEDFHFLTFHIELAGDSQKGISKADIIFTAYKDSFENVKSKIEASLKAYKSPTINLANTSFVSFIKTIFYDKGGAPNSLDEFIEQFIIDFGSKSRNELTRLKYLQNIIPTLTNKGSSKEDARKEAKLTHGEVIDILTIIFNNYYKSNKEKVNKRMVKLLGFDGSEDFYAAIGKGSKIQVLSSRNSKEFNQMIQKLTKDFTLTINRNGTTNNANIVFVDSSGDNIISTNMTFADSGGKYAAGKTNVFLNMKKFL